MAVENDPSFWKWVAGGIVSTLGAAWGGFKYLDARFDRKADKAETERCLKHIEKLYENAEADRKLTRDLHDKAMEGVRDGQREIIALLIKAVNRS